MRLRSWSWLVVVAACSVKSPHTPDPGLTPALPATVARLAPAMVIYTAASAGVRAVVAAAEDGSSAPRVLSLPGVDTAFVAALPDRTVLLSEQRAGGEVSRLVVRETASDQRRILAKLPAEAHYTQASAAESAGDRVVVTLVRAADAGRSDIYIVGAGAPRLLAQRAVLLGVAAGRIAYLAGPNASVGVGDVTSAALDGTDVRELGGGDGADRVADVTGDHLLVNLHGGDAARVRRVRFDGGEATELGPLGATAVGVSGARVLLAEAGRLSSSALDGSDLRELGSGTALAVTPDGQVVYASGNALMAASLLGGAPVVLDPAAGQSPHVAHLAGPIVIYTGETPAALSLRAAHLDGSGTTVLCEKPLWLPTFQAVLPDGRVVFDRRLAGQLEGGGTYTVKLDGSELRPISTEVDRADGLPEHANDQDFEAVTPAGRLIVEVESEGEPGRRLVTTTADQGNPRQLTEMGAIRFAGLVR